MSGGVEQRMIEGAMQLLAQKGLQGTSFSEILAATGAPRGSLYHHFPGGKDELVGAAVDRAGQILMQAMDPVAGSPAEKVVERFLTIWRTVLTRSQCTAGCAVLAVSVATDSPQLLSHAAAVFRAWRGHLTALLQQGGLAAEDAGRFALALIASAEGAVVLSRAEHNVEPFEAVAHQLMAQVRALSSGQNSRTPGS